jgi:hypothetical protein
MAAGLGRSVMGTTWSMKSTSVRDVPEDTRIATW